MREELKRRITELESQIHNFSYETDEAHKGSYEKDTLARLERLQILWEDLDY